MAATVRARRRASNGRVTERRAGADRLHAGRPGARGPPSGTLDAKESQNPHVVAPKCPSGLVALAAAAPSGPGHAADAAAPADAPRLPASLEACAQLRVDAERLACYDQVVAPQVRGARRGAGRRGERAG